MASPEPVYRKEWANNFLGTHTAHLFALATEIYYLHVEIYPDRELIDVDKPLYKAGKMLEEAEYWRELD